MTLAELRSAYERNELQGESLVDALVRLLGYTKSDAEMIVSRDYLPVQDGDQQTIA